MVALQFLFSTVYRRLKRFFVVVFYIYIYFCFDVNGQRSGTPIEVTDKFHIEKV